MTADQGTSHSHTHRALVYNPNIGDRPQRSMTASDTSAEQEEKAYPCRVQVCSKKYANPTKANRHMADEHNIGHTHVSMYKIPKEPHVCNCRIGLCTWKLRTMSGMDKHMMIVHELPLKVSTCFMLRGLQLQRCVYAGQTSRAQTTRLWT
jgi:hypothetical protein